MTVIQLAERPPWSLLIGDHAETLQHLGEQPEPTELTTFNIWCVQTSGCRPEREMRETFDLALELSFTNKFAESQHSRTACLKRLHPDYSLETLFSRVTVC